jgi:threonine/homoserine/homoserine lactone efflux protein
MTFIPEAHILLAYLLGVVVITLTPGPDMTFFVGRSIAQGAIAGLAAMSGAVTGIIVHSLFVAFGLSALVLASPLLFTIVKIAGALYLGWLAIDAIRNGSTFRISERQQRQRSLFANWLQGLAINLLNPKIILFFMTFLPQFVDASDPHAPGKLFFLGVFFVVVAAPLMVPLILAAGKFAEWMKNNPKVTRVTDYLFATVFGGFAVSILLTQRG